MPDKKPTDSEIVKILEVCCTKRICKECIYLGNKELCIADNTIAVLDLINRLQAENERLKTFEDKIAEFKSHIRVEDMLVFANSLEEWLEFCDNLKAEAYKECIEKAKEVVEKEKPYNYGNFIYLLNNLLKELVGA